jgi:hypothetical protein
MGLIGPDRDRRRYDKSVRAGVRSVEREESRCGNTVKVSCEFGNCDESCLRDDEAIQLMATARRLAMTFSGFIA